ncbi:MAG: amidase [Paracoccaceae bacterium]|jgi:amidase
MTDLFRCSASDIARAVRGRSISAVEVTQAHIDRMDQVNQAINAVVQDGRVEAMEAARAVDAQIAKGEDPGPMAGVPFTTKVNVDQAGFATTNGLVALKDAIAAQDSPVVANIRKAGGIIIGRTNTPAFSLRWFTKNKLHGQTLNPRNGSITPGGSSGGAAAAVASGICAIGHGTDIAGSVRYPAYACGLHGLRPTMGRVPAYNATSPDRFIGAQVMAVSGPIARTMEDIALALHAMSAADARDPWYVPAPLQSGPFKKHAALTLAPDGMPVQPAVKAALTAAARILEAAGWEVEEVPCPPMRVAAEINATLWMAESKYGSDVLMKREAEPDSLFVYEIMRREAGLVDLDAVMTALQMRASLVRQWEVFLQKYPILICPISGELPFDQQLDVRSEADFLRIYEAQLTQRGLPAMGMPALAVATGTADGKPVGVQLVAGRFREDVLIAAGMDIEAASPTPDVADP